MTGGSLAMELRKWNVKDMTEVDKAQQEKNFTGDFTMRKLPEEANSDEEIYFVEFRKGCMTNPHIHMSEQILVVTEGKGIVVFIEKMDLNESHESARISKKEYEINKGDIVRVPAGLIHWHGAIKDNDFSHIAIRKKTSTETIWL
jgi:4-carboxymuconolactone decarboxylase